VNDATRTVEEAPWRSVDRPRRCGFWAAVRALSRAAIVAPIALASSAIGATGSLSSQTPVSTPSIFAPVSTRRSPSVTYPISSWASGRSSSSA
jgi:hypothetical protein